MIKVNNLIIPSLTDQVKIPMSNRQSNAMTILDKEDFSGIISFTRKELNKQFITLTNDDCVRAIYALKQYYSLSIFDPYNMHAIPELLDPFWHSHILDTVRYQLLCEAIGGFMHHDPLDHEDKDKVNAIVYTYTYTRKVLVTLYGEKKLDLKFYPINPPTSSMVCRHDVELKTELEDVFPKNDKVQVLQSKYGYQNQRKQLLMQLV